MGLVVVGSRSLGSLRHVVLGSVSNAAPFSYRQPSEESQKRWLKFALV